MIQEQEDFLDDMGRHVRDVLEHDPLTTADKVAIGRIANKVRLTMEAAGRDWRVWRNTYILIDYTPNTLDRWVRASMAVDDPNIYTNEEMNILDLERALVRATTPRHSKRWVIPRTR